MTADAPDPFAVLDALGIVGPARAERVLGGADTTIWRVEQGDHVSALRLFRANQAATAEREIATMAAAAGTVPVPAVRAAGRWGDRPALLLAWCPGRPLRDEIRAHPWRTWALGVRFGRVQAAIHATPPPPALREHPVPWIDWAGPDEALRRCLRATAPRPPALLHLDYHPLNVMAGGGDITAVLDWANARVGDPRADLARTASILRFGPADPAVPLPIARATRRVLDAGWRHGYRQVAGRIAGMAPFYAWAGAVMVRDLAPRLGRPDLPWLTAAYLERVRAWADGWRTKAGCDP